MIQVLDEVFQLMLNLGATDAQLDFRIVERIEETATGKFRYTVRKAV